jgi:glutamine amidotransferase
MCRLLAYRGPRVRVADLIIDAPHSLLDQVTDAREQTSGHENPDGWGLGWYEPTRSEPERFRTTTPMPDDPVGLARAQEVHAACFVAHIRHKSPGSPIEVAGNAPFVDGRWVFAHNGFVEHFRDGRREELRAAVSERRRSELRGDADSEVVFALVLDQLDAGASAPEALGGVVARLGAGGGRYNTVLTDGVVLLATRWDNSLHVRRDDPALGSVVLASEPYDDRPGWETVPDQTLIRVDGEGLTIAPLDPSPVEASP